MLNGVGRASGSLFGSAYGDALGAPTEFLDMDGIRRRYGPDGPRELDGDPARVTDDTQMALAVGEALAEAGGDFSPARLEPLLRTAFVAWASSPDNNRAPGMTCLRACGELARGVRWQQATVAGSKGCGANMRVAPVGLVPGMSGAERAGAAQLQAALTHGHPTALAASELTAYAVRFLACGGAVPDLVGALRDRGESQRTVYREDWLGDLWQRPGVDDPAGFIGRGWTECLAVLDAVERGVSAGDRDGDPCATTGAGWIAEEALATGLLCFLLYPDDPVSALARAAATSGDSDSIACLAGAFAGAAYGMAAWPAGWADRIEYRGRLGRLGAAWDGPG